MNSFIICILCLLICQTLCQDLINLENSTITYISEAPDCRSTAPRSCTPNCKGIKVCFLNSLRNIRCPPAKPYCDPTTLTCSMTPTSCEGTMVAPTFRCPGPGYYPYTLDCKKFWNCNGDRPVVATCVSGVFDALNKKCKLGVECLDFSYDSGYCGKNENMFVVHPDNPAIHILCSGDFPEVGECPKNTVFNPMKNRCEWKCTEEDLYKDPLNDSCFFQCQKLDTDRWLSDYFCCESGYIFDDSLNTCVEI